MVTAGIAAGYLASPRLKDVHWQAGSRPVPGPQVSMAGESAQFVDPAEIPAGADVARLGRALARGQRGDLHQLMAATAAYTGLRQGELFAPTIDQVNAAARVITVDCKVIEVSGKLYLEAPKGRSAAAPSTPPAPRPRLLAARPARSAWPACSSRPRHWSQEISSLRRWPGSARRLARTRADSGSGFCASALSRAGRVSAVAAWSRPGW